VLVLVRAMVKRPTVGHAEDQGALKQLHFDLQTVCVCWCRWGGPLRACNLHPCRFAKSRTRQQCTAGLLLVRMQRKASTRAVRNQPVHLL
jgi:hypothetical protein